MQTIGIKTLKNRLSEYLRLVAAGETIRVTDRGRVVAELVPPRQPSEDEAKMTPAERQFAELIRQGHITPAKRPPGPPPRSMPVMTFDALMKEIADDREDR